MSQEAKARRIYEQRVNAEALSRLSKVVDVGGLPLAQTELQTFQKRVREAIFGSPHRKERLVRYKAHLATLHDPQVIERLAHELDQINNQIAWEEK